METSSLRGWPSGAPSAAVRWRSPSWRRPASLPGSCIRRSRHWTTRISGPPICSRSATTRPSTAPSRWRRPRSNCRKRPAYIAAAGIGRRAYPRRPSARGARLPDPQPHRPAGADPDRIVGNARHISPPRAAPRRAHRRDPAKPRLRSGGDRRAARRQGDRMSKAFVKETDDEPDLPDDAPQLPSGLKNYMTPEGHLQMQEELRRLLREERPKTVEVVAWAAGNGDRSENGDYLYGKKRLREIDRRIRFLTKRLESAEVVDPSRQTRRDQVFFGASVTYANEDGGDRTVTLVGVDEADLDRSRISWISPVARALLKSQEGDLVELRTPSGSERIEVLEIRYGEG